MVNNGYTIEFPPEAVGLNQDGEYCLLNKNGEKRKIRFHNYDEIFKVPGLYELLFHEKLKCESPDVISGMLAAETEKENLSKKNIKTIEIGAGNGVVGEALWKKGFKKIIGVDILEEAEQAAKRDRPNLYDKYYVDDLTRLSVKTRKELENEKFNCLVCVAALGFSDIPPQAFIQGFNFISDGGWVAFNIKVHFVGDEDSSGFSDLIDKITNNGTLEIKSKKIYRHRNSIEGKPLEYMGIVGIKNRAIPL